MTKKGHVASEAELAKKRAWYAANRDHEKAKQKAWRDANKAKRADRQRETGPAYYLANKERFQEAGKRFRAKVKADRPWLIPLRTSKSRATQKGLLFDLTEEWAKSIWTGKCAITGLEFRPDTTGTPGPKPFSPTIDRIDQTKGYIPGNCRFILSCVNNFRGTMGDADMHLVATAIVHGGSALEVSERMSTQTCSACGSIPPSRPRGIAGLHKRNWVCDECGSVHDRDVNAARNILRSGLATLVAGTPIEAGGDSATALRNSVLQGGE